LRYAERNTDNVKRSCCSCKIGIRSLQFGNFFSDVKFVKNFEMFAVQALISVKLDECRDSITTADQLIRDHEPRWCNTPVYHCSAGRCPTHTKSAMPVTTNFNQLFLVSIPDGWSTKSKPQMFIHSQLHRILINQSNCLNSFASHISDKLKIQ